MFQNFHLFGNDLAIQYTVVTRIETRGTKTPGETFFSSVQFSCSDVSDSLGPGGLQDARLPSPSATPGACSNSCPSSQWSHPNILSYVVPFSSAFNQDYERQIFWSIIIVKGLSKSSYHIYIFYFCCCRFQVVSCWQACDRYNNRAIFTSKET